MQGSSTIAVAGELRRGWRVLTASALGVTCGVTAVPIYTIGAFVGPLEQTYGWSRGSIQSATIFAYTAVVFAGLLAGGIVDRVGARRVAIWSVVGISLAVASVAMLAQSLVGFYAAYALIGLLGAGTSPAVWTRAINGWFDKRRGFALGLTLMGTGIFATLGPGYVTWAIQNFGWRVAYLALALVPLVIVLPAVLLWFHERGSSPSAVAGPVPDLTGMTLAAAMETRTFWTIAVTFLFFSTVISGYIANYIPMLTDTGMTPANAAARAGLIGIAVIIGRFTIGLVLDHARIPVVSTVVMSLPAVGCFAWGIGLSGDTGALAAALLVGLAAGAEFDLVAYMAARYFGLKHYGKVTGILYSAVIAGGAIGPMLFGFAYDVFGSYSPVLLVGAGVFALAGAAQMTLGQDLRHA